MLRINGIILLLVLAPSQTSTDTSAQTETTTQRPYRTTTVISDTTTCMPSEPTTPGPIEWTSWFKTFSDICREPCTRKEQFARLCLQNGRVLTKRKCPGRTFFMTKYQNCSGDLCKQEKGGIGMIPPHYVYQIYHFLSGQNESTPPKCGELSGYNDSAHTEVEHLSSGYTNESNLNPTPSTQTTITPMTKLPTTFVPTRHVSTTAFPTTEPATTMISSTGAPVISVDGKWSGWARIHLGDCNLSTCTMDAEFLRRCNKPAPQGNGQYCLGEFYQMLIVKCPQDCSFDPVPRNAVNGSWSPWRTRHYKDNCDHYCRKENQLIRKCSNPPPSNGGVWCTGMKAIHKKVKCTGFQCKTEPSVKPVIAAEARREGDDSAVDSAVDRSTLWIVLSVLFIIGVATVVAVVVVRSKQKRGQLPTIMNPAERILRTFRRLSFLGRRKGDEDNLI